MAHLIKCHCVEYTKAKKKIKAANFFTRHTTHPPPQERLSMRIKQLLLLVFFAYGYLAYATNHSFAAPPPPQQRITQLLALYNAQQAKQAAKLLAPTIQKQLPVTQLKHRFRSVYQVIGRCQTNTLTLVSQQALHGKTRFIWRASFAKEQGFVLALFNAKHQIEGFFIHSATLRKKRTETKTVPKPSATQMKHINTMLHSLLSGYNTSSWTLFCQYCTPVMKQLFKKGRFSAMRAILWKRYGAYKRCRFHQNKQLVMAVHTYVMRFRCDFSKQGKRTVQIVVQGNATQARLASWKVW
jgi:hypothetical protein